MVRVHANGDEGARVHFMHAQTALCYYYGLPA